MPAHPFDEDTEVQPAGDGRVRATIANRRWWVVRGPNGGFVAAILVRALGAALGDPERVPRSLTIHYPGAPEEGPLDVEVTVERVGRTVAYLSARATQGERTIALALAAFAAPFPGPEFQDLPAPDIPPPDAVEPVALPGAPPFTENFEYRPAIGPRPFTRADRAVSGGWIRFREPRGLDWAAVAALTDAWFPAIFAKLDNVAVVPTVDLTIHFRDAPPADPGEFALAKFWTTTARQGFFEEDGAIWSADGRLLAQSRQLAVLL